MKLSMNYMTKENNLYGHYFNEKKKIKIFVIFVMI